MTATNEAERKQQLRDFQRNAHRLLSEDDRDYLHYVMKEYQTYKSVEKLVMALKSCLDTPRKLDLLADIRNLVPKAHLSKFDSLVPYHKMAHPIRPPNQIAADRKTQSLNLKNGELKELHQNGDDSSFKVVTLVKTSPEQVLGFSIRGGREHGCGVYVSQIDVDSQSEKQGLQVGDQIIEVNGINFERIALNSAINLLSSLSKIKLVLRTGGKMPDLTEGKPSKSPVDQNGKTSPNGIAENESLQNSSASSGSHVGITLQHNPHLLNSSEERRINFVVEETPNGFIGFNLRGGAEYGLGIFVSGVDTGSLAQEAGFRVGDVILDVNGTSFENIKHKDAVEFIKSNKHIIATVKAAGKLPEAKHYSAEISWILPDGSVVRETKEHFSRSLSMPPSPVSPMDLSTTSMQFSALDRMGSLKPELREFGVQTPGEPVDNRMSPIHMSTPVQTPPPPNDHVDGSPELQRTTSAKSVATTVSTSSGDTEKRQSMGSTNSREDMEKRYSSSNADVIMMASGSDGEAAGGRSRKVKKSKSFLQKHGDKIKSKLSFRKKSKPKMEMKGGPSKQQLLLYIEERAKKILVVDEYNSLIKHIIQYLDDSDVETLVKKLLAILDKPEKSLLLRDVRTLVSAYDLGRFDAIVSANEKDAQEYLSVCVPGSPTIIPTAVEKPKRQLVSVIQDSRGGFQIRSKEELERLRREKEEHSKMRNQVAWLGGNILDRQQREAPSEYYAVNSTTPEPMDLAPVRDSGPSIEPSPRPMQVEVPYIQVPNGPISDDSVPVHKASNTLMVPDRVAMEYDDDDDDEPAVMGGQQSAFVAVPVPSIAVSTAPSEECILLHKNRTSLGISISGGKGSKTQPEIRIEKIFPGGAAADDGRLKNGDEVISVDTISLQGVTHAEAVDIIRRSYNDKSKDAMQIVVMAKQG